MKTACISANPSFDRKKSFHDLLKTCTEKSLLYEIFAPVSSNVCLVRKSHTEITILSL